MREKDSKKRYKRRFLRNLSKYSTYFKSNGLEIEDDSPCSNIGSISCLCHYPLGLAEAKNVLNCDFPVTEGPRILKLGRTVIYKIQMISKKIS